MGINLKEVSPRARKLVLAIMAVMFASLLYGGLMFPDGPISPCKFGTGYCGKHGEVHSQADYESFRRWSIFMFVLWPSGMLGMIALSGKRKPK
jgi:hypothetical protein